MPGHLKKSEGPDPDPKPWLEVSEKLKNDLKCKPYDGKKSCWVPDKVTGGFKEGLIQNFEGDDATIIIDDDKVKIISTCWIIILFIAIKVLEKLFEPKYVFCPLICRK